MIENNFLYKNQHGFVPGRSCVTQLLQVLDKWTDILDGGGEVDCVYLDFWICLELDWLIFKR